MINSASPAKKGNSYRKAAVKIETTSGQSQITTKDPSSVKDKVVQRLLIKMGEQFGDDPFTLQVIGKVIWLYTKNGQALKPTDIDQMEKDIF